MTDTPTSPLSKEAAASRRVMGLNKPDFDALPAWVNRYSDRKDPIVGDEKEPKKPNFFMRRIGAIALVGGLMSTGAALVYEFNGPRVDAYTATVPVGPNGVDAAFNDAIAEAEQQNDIKFVNNNIFIGDALNLATETIQDELEPSRNSDYSVPTGTEISVTTSKGPLFGIPFVEGHVVTNEPLDTN